MNAVNTVKTAPPATPAVPTEPPTAAESTALAAGLLNFSPGVWH